MPFSHYSVPNIPNIPGLEEFRGEVLHSHDYRVPEPYTGEVRPLMGPGHWWGQITAEVRPPGQDRYW